MKQSKELREMAFRIRNRANAPQDSWDIETAEMLEKAADRIDIQTWIIAGLAFLTLVASINMILAGAIYIFF